MYSDRERMKTYFKVVSVLAQGSHAREHAVFGVFSVLTLLSKCEGQTDCFCVQLPPKCFYLKFIRSTDFEYIWKGSVCVSFSIQCILR